MTIHCPDCGDGDMVEHTTVTRIGDIDGWICISCSVFYDKKKLKKTILTV